MKLTHVLWSSPLLAQLVLANTSSRQEASQVLASKSTRSNNGQFEEVGQDADVERECYEETCSYQELSEAIPDQDQRDKVWNELTMQCETRTPCNPNYSTGCKNRWYDYKCDCVDDRVGKNCDDPLIPGTTEAPATTQPVKKPKADDFGITCDQQSMSVSLSTASALSQKMKDGLSNRKINVQKNDNANCAGESRVLQFGDSSRISMDLNDDCFVDASYDETFMYYTFEFYMPPAMDRTSETVVTDWGTYWLATCKYDRWKFVTVQDGSNVLPVLHWDEAQKNKDEPESQGWDYKNSGKDEATGDFRVTLQVYEDQSYSRAYQVKDFPLNYAMGERIHAEISFVDARHNSWLSLLGKNCWASPDAYSNDKLNLIKNACEVNSLVEIENSGDSSHDRFSTQTFKWPGDQLYMYLKCEVVICNDSSDCERQCDNLPKKKKRTAELGNGHQLVSIGPFRTHQTESLTRDSNTIQAQENAFTNVDSGNVTFAGILFSVGALALVAAGILLVIKR